MVAIIGSVGPPCQVFEHPRRLRPSLVLQQSLLTQFVTLIGAVYIDPTGSRPQPIQALFWADLYLPIEASGGGSSARAMRLDGSRMGSFV
jgi:hypothetical protein